MSKVITALEHSQNALLEAPTGSGKTLSILCAVLSWQQREKQRIEDDARLLSSMNAQHQSHQHVDHTADVHFIHNQSPLPQPSASAMHNPKMNHDGFFPESQSDPQAPHQLHNLPKRKLPTIYYATRTHSQIAQVIRELKRTPYKPKMAVLAAKQHYCINTHARRQSSLEEACEDLLKEGNCKYSRGVQGLIHCSPDSSSIPESSSWSGVHDIEDLTRLGSRRRACPYYVSRKWAQEAELVFAPYSYLADPVIRRSMGIGRMMLTWILI